ncbi:gamma-glutamyltranspeptidase [Chloropicon primus]|uniref:Gamma-glutamyltranspeptidase n=1 Tax=Chloropicon primus TaxID=1764295 RepID=A0A5B8MEU0_9CHLO|nr:gamma-glutamyltranspeptidase [Chloropicon primus]UPQ98137.1 gamma-glutamyltranspeptidase [Chloropicon primus]|eukprot:QDZ18929.1 gamma-glutamyltranspeptidase [Chloropicon primus]
MSVFAKQYTDGDMGFNSRRSPMYGTRGMCSSSQPLATEAGLAILRKGGNAADACVAMAAALNVTEPCSTGIGGDAFCLFYNQETKEVKCILGNGRSPAGLEEGLIRDRGFESGIPPQNALNVTVPGAAACWCDVAKTFGTMKMSDLLEPATDLARSGFPVSPITAHCWQASSYQLLESETSGEDLLIRDKGGAYRAPKAGEVFKNPRLAKVFDTLAEEGKEGFYTGWIGKRIVEAVCSRGGVMSLADLKSHSSELRDPIMSTFRGIEVYEVPPPTQGIVALMALNLMEEKAAFNGTESYNRQLHHKAMSADRLHLDIECVRCAFAEAVKHIGDPQQFGDEKDSSDHWHNISQLTSKRFARLKAASVSESAAAAASDLDDPDRVRNALGASHDTVYFCAVDRWGNGCSMINSNYMSFGTGIVPKDCGFSMQNRGHGFTPLSHGSHPNTIGPSKRPYHTIIPGLATYPGGESLYGTFGVMGGFMQPQGHAQVLRNMLDLGMDPQQALDQPRFFVSIADYSIGENIFDTISGKMPKVFLESLIPEPVAEDLRSRGHQVVSQVQGMKRSMFGRGQIIRRDPKSGVLTAGSDPRADGCAMGF